MEFGEFSKANYSISLDTKSQLFSARSNEATGVTIQDALSELSKLDAKIRL